MHALGIRLLSLAALVIAAVCLAPGVAAAGIRTVTIADPQDAPAPAPGGAKNPDLKSVAIQYNDQSGTIVAVASFYESVAARTAETNVTFDLGAIPVAKGACQASPSAPAAQGLMFVKQSVGLLSLDGYDPLILSSSAALSADGLTFTVRFADAALSGFDYRCADVSSVWMSAYTNPAICSYFGCPTTNTDLDPVAKNAWFDGFAPTPAAPTSVTVTAATGSSVALRWQDADSSVTGYEVLRDGQVIGTTTATSFTVPNLACGKSYTVSIRADTPYAHSADSAVAANTTACAPKPPAHVRVAGATATSLTVAWGAEANVTEYIVLVGSHSVRTKSTQLTVGGLHCGAHYAVKVHAVGPGGPSATVTVTGRTRHC